jgi:hypothetical protein
MEGKEFKLETLYDKLENLSIGKRRLNEVKVAERR